MPDDYQRIAQAIEYLNTHASEQPSLATVAQHVHLSEYHFQKVFSRWAGVSPKRYLQALTLERAKLLLKSKEASLLDSSLELGLSSPSRLHDHFIQIEAVSPVQYKNQGQNLRFYYGTCTTLFGHAFIAQSSKGISRIDFIDKDGTDAALQIFQKQWPKAEFILDNALTTATAERIFCQGNKPEQTLSLWIKGTNFQLNVWRALLRLNFGAVATYSDIAQQIGKPKAVRAVGTAIGSNPVALLIPCHRVLTKSGALGGYRWGETRKQCILAREAAQFE